jgi:hypothetical protein
MLSSNPSESTAAAYYEPFTISFHDGESAKAVVVPRQGDPDSVLSALGLKPGPVIFIMGGAGFMEEESLRAIRSIVETGLAHFAEEHRVTVIDGGTATGVMAVMGTARRVSGYSFPLIGVAPHGQVEYPNHRLGGDDPVQLDVSHSHFVLVDGDEFGDESDMIAMLATAISRDRWLPALGLVINGGQIVRKEVYARSASNNMRFPLLVLAGSGRFADELARAKQSNEIAEGSDPNEIEAILAGDVAFLSITEGAEGLHARLSEYFVS